MIQVVSKVSVRNLVQALILSLTYCIALLHKRCCEVGQELLRFGRKLKKLIDLRLIRLVSREGTLSGVALFGAVNSFGCLYSRYC